jgi:hypothetical protein
MKFNLFPPSIIFYVEKLPFEWAAGAANGPIIRIKKTHKDNPGIHAHELFHVFQWWITLGLHPILYVLIPHYRYWSEVWAYRRSLLHRPTSLDHYTSAIINKYKLGSLKLTREKVIRDLTKGKVK